MNSATPSSTHQNESQSVGDSNETEASPPAFRPLRVWPTVLFVVLMWGMRIGAGLVEEPSMTVIMTRYMGPCGAAVCILLWWIFFSRATNKEKLLGTIGLVVITTVSTLLMDKTLYGFGTIIFAAPWGATAFVVAAICTRSWYPVRTVLALSAALIGYGYWDLVRADEFSGGFEVGLSWRWEPTPEDIFLEKLAARSLKSPTELPMKSIGPLGESEWPGFRGADRRGEQPDVVLVEDWKTHPPKEVWRIPVGPGWSSFSVAGNRLFTQQQRGEHEAVVCYSAEDGRELWVQQDETRFWEAIGGVGPRGTPTIANGGLFTLGANGLLNRLDPVNGTLVWQSDIREDADRSPPTWGFSSSPLVTHGVVIVHAGGDDDKGLLAYDEASGDLRWGAAAGDHSYSSPQLSTVDGRECVLMLTNKGLGIVDPEDGSVLGDHAWDFDGYRVVQPLVFDSATLLLGTPMSTGTQCIDAQWDGRKYDIETRWTSTRMKPYFNDFVFHNGFLYGFDNNIFACVDVSNGERKWKRGRYGNGQVLLLPTEDQLLVISEKGELVLLRARPEKSTELARRQVLSGRTWNHPVVVGDRLYVRNGEEAACFELAIK